MKEYQIIWSPTAAETYFFILSNILNKWSIKEAEEFESKVNSLLEKLRVHHKLCPSSKSLKYLRRCVITRQTSLVYRINNNAIELVTFYDNRSELGF